MSGAPDGRRQPAPSSHRGVYWRFLGGLFAFQAVVWGLAAALAYLIADPELAKDYLSAHQTVKQTRRLLVPALATAAAAGLAVTIAGTALALRGFSRRLREPVAQLDGVLRSLAEGRIPAPATGPRRAGPAEEAAAVLAPLRARVKELQRVSRELQKSTLELSYRAGGTAELTLKDLRSLAGQLDASSKELAEAVRWFEG